MGTRLNLQSKLEELLGSRYVYYQPSPNVKMTYPAITYVKGKLTRVYANNKTYRLLTRYDLNIKYLNLMSVEEYSATIEAFMYPDEFEECDGTKEIAPGVTIGQQKRSTFGLCYKTILGNDTDGDDHGYKLHMIYSRKYSSV